MLVPLMNVILLKVDVPLLLLFVMMVINVPKNIAIQPQVVLELQFVVVMVMLVQEIIVPPKRVV
jgi:hypothetical protein